MTTRFCDRGHGAMANGALYGCPALDGRCVAVAGADALRCANFVQRNEWPQPGEEFDLEDQAAGARPSNVVEPILDMIKG
jgi:hypothetical protein